jgi:hypothetical protein
MLCFFLIHVQVVFLRIEVKMANEFNNLTTGAE